MPKSRRAIHSTSVGQASNLPPASSTSLSCRRNSTISVPATCSHCRQTGDEYGFSGAASEQNSILLTERCNHYCLMCSQPPRNVQDDRLLDEAIELIRLLPRSTRGLGFTGGEPTLYGTRLL